MIDLAVDAAAVYRLTRLVTTDTFPPIKALRDRIVDAHTDTTDGIAPDAIAELIQCPFCCSVWLAAGVVVARSLLPRQWAPVAKMLALAAVAGNVSSVLDE